MILINELWTRMQQKDLTNEKKHAHRSQFSLSIINFYTSRRRRIDRVNEQKLDVFSLVFLVCSLSADEDSFMWFINFLRITIALRRAYHKSGERRTICRFFLISNLKDKKKKLNFSFVACVDLDIDVLCAHSTRTKRTDSDLGTGSWNERKKRPLRRDI